MKMMDMPIGAPMYRDEEYFKINQDISSFFGFIDVLVKCNSNILPVLPISSNDKYVEIGNIFPRALLGVYILLKN
jgi:hypothetical protein